MSDSHANVTDRRGKQRQRIFLMRVLQELNSLAGSDNRRHLDSLHKVKNIQNVKHLDTLNNRLELSKLCSSQGKQKWEGKNLSKDFKVFHYRKNNHTSYTISFLLMDTKSPNI